MSAMDAVELVRRLRPGSIETKSQMKFARAFANAVGAWRSLFNTHGTELDAATSIRHHQLLWWTHRKTNQIRRARTRYWDAAIAADAVLPELAAASMALLRTSGTGASTGAASHDIHPQGASIPFNASTDVARSFSLLAAVKQ